MYVQYVALLRYRFSSAPRFIHTRPLISSLQTIYARYHKSPKATPLAKYRAIRYAVGPLVASGYVVCVVFVFIQLASSPSYKSLRYLQYTEGLPRFLFSPSPLSFSDSSSPTFHLSVAVAVVRFQSHHWLRPCQVIY